jgi:hypothetical protein
MGFVNFTSNRLYNSCSRSFDNNDTVIIIDKKIAHEWWKGESGEGIGALQ